MSNPSKQRGTKFETAVVRYLVENGHPYAERRAQRGRNDGGDIAGIPGVCIECKATARIELAAALDEAETEGRNTGAAIAVAVIKRRGRPVRDAYVVMSLARFAALERNTD